MEANNMEIYEQQHQDEGEFDFDSIVLRRADPDDCDQIINLVEVGKDDVYNRVYSYPKVLKLIETAYLAITVLDREGRVVAFAAFEDYPQGMRGMYDEKHYNCWENWFKKAYGVEEFSTYNALWLTYFIAGGSIGYADQRFAFKKILQTVYTSLADLIGILFLQRGDADVDDINYCFDPVRDYFEELPCQQRDVLKEVRGIHPNSTMYFSSRVIVLPYVEIRDAKQEDHDDLADVFNSQSDTVTEAYGEYFIAELIAAQNANNKALVAQVKDKAVGLMGLTSEVDVKLLHQCFELDSFDNLLKPEFMNAIRKRRHALLEEKRKKAELERLEELRRLKEETMKCNIISQRIQLQEYLLSQEQTLAKTLEDKIQDEENFKSLDRQSVEVFMDEILAAFKITQPSHYFDPDQHPTDDFELVCNALSEKEFLLQTLEIFGLPQGYMEGNGHFPDWGKDTTDRLAAAKKRALAQKTKPKKQSAALARMKKERGLDQKEETDKKPTHFDLSPLLKALKRFLACNGETRSRLRMDLREHLNTIKKIFVDEYGEISYKKCVNVQEFGKRMQERGINLDQRIMENVGPIMVCFGDIKYDIKATYRLPEETEEERRAAALKKIKEEEEKKAALEGIDPSKAKKKKEEKKEEAAQEEKKEEPQKKEPPKPIKIWQYLTSIYDLQNALEKMHEYDFMLNELGYMTFDLSWEKEKIQNLKLGGDKQKVLAKGLSSVQAQQVAHVVQKQPLDHKGPVHYSEDRHYHDIVKDITDFETIPEPPEKAKNAFAITLFCVEAAFDSRSKDFLKHAFDRFPDRDYLIVTQPHTVAENSLLQKFTLVPKKSENTFTHVLYIIHRDSLFEEDLEVRRATAEDLPRIKDLIETLEDKETAYKQIYEATVNSDSPNLAFICKIYDDVIGAFLLAKDVNLDYYKSHFHIQDAVLLNEHERKAHTRLIFSVINPIFERSTRFILKELMRLSANTCMYFEIHDKTIIPTIFHELVHVRSRRFPHFLDRKWDHERYVPPITQGQQNESTHIDGKDRDPQDEIESPFALCFTTKRLLSEPKIVKNSRIVVVGASDTGISFIEALLSIGYLQFTNIVLIAPGGLSHHHVGEKRAQNLKSYSTSYTQQELKRLMLETRVRVINARMVDIDRSDKNIILDDDNKIIPYDTLVLAMGLQDKTLPSLGFASRGIAPISEDKKHLEGLLSVDDPKLYDHLRQGGTLMNALTNRRRPQNCVIYGRSLHSYACIKGLINRGMRPEQITLILPGPTCHLAAQYDDEEDMMNDLPYINPQAFEDEYIESKIHRILEKKGVRIVRNALLMQVIENDESQVESVLFKLLDIPDEEEDEDEIEGIDEDQAQQDQPERDSKLSSGQNGGMDGESVEGGEGENKSQNQEEQVVLKKKRKKNELELQCRVLITAGHKDVDDDVFNSIHNNGLVYNGRLIVDKNFQTTDPSIFAAGPLCEFSGRYKAIAQGKSLRMDRYNGREMGSRLARCVFDIYDPSSATANAGGEGIDELPTFYLPQGEGAILPGDVIYYHIKTTNPLVVKQGARSVIIKNRSDLMCDNLNDDNLKGHFIKFSFNSIGLIDSVTYMGSEDIILQSLWSFVGLHENYLNSLTSRFEKGIIPNVVEFLSENWAMALYHEWFGDFCLRMRNSIQGLRDVQAILEQAFESTKNGEGLTREQFRDLRKLLDAKTVKMIEDETLEFIKVNMNHLPMYYVPGEEFA